MPTARRLAPVLVALAAGCGGPPEFPPTYPVKGRVLADGDAPLAGGYVEFESVAQPELRGVGRVGPDGTFDGVATYKPSGQEVPGLVEGQHRVRVEPAGGERGRGPKVPKRGLAFDGGVTVTVAPGDNDLTVRLAGQ